MSAILITRTNDYVLPNLGRYFTAELTDGKHSISVTVKPAGNHEALRVIVRNASHRAFRGMGKGFPSVETALAAYKTGAIRNMISKAVELSQGGMQ